MAAALDLALDDDTGDLVVEDGDLALVEEADVVAQKLRNTLRTVLGEWYLDTTHGVDYFGAILIKGAQQARVESELREKILGVEGVAELTSFQAEYDETRRRFRLVFSVRTDSGVAVSVSVAVPPVSPEPPPEEPP
jgi:hypothetical protein